MLRDLFQPTHLLIILVLIAVLFGAKRLPDAARGLGQSMRIFKSEVKEMKKDDEKKPSSASDEARPDALEGRLVDGTADRATARSEQRRDL
jgi:sec-independent protein translocase protein TatA